MRVISEGKESIVKLWGNPLPQDANYRLMRYQVREECQDGILLCNTVTGELVQLSPEENALLDVLPSPHVSEMDDLIAHHFLVPESFDELKAVNQLRNIMRCVNSCKSIRGFTILPTTGCNARCFYCYESSFPHVTMNPEMADKVVDFISNHCGEEKSVHLHWFGGEPMLATDRIDQICSGLHERGIVYKSRMTSNSLLFSESLAKHARHQWHLYEIQITLDGTEKVYNETKSYVGVKGNPYRTVLDNIGFLLEQKVHVIVRLNLGLHNAMILSDLVQEIKVLYGDHRNLTVYVGILFDDMGFVKVHHSESDSEKLELVKRKLELEIEDAGIRCKRDHQFPYLRTTHCMADNPQSVLISPLGDIGKCEHAVFDRLVGNLQTGLFDENMMKYWEKIHEWPECEACCLYPSCVMLEGCEPLKPCHRISLEDRVSEVKKQMIKELERGKRQ